MCVCVCVCGKIFFSVVGPKREIFLNEKVQEEICILFRFIYLFRSYICVCFSLVFEYFSI